MQIVNYRDFLLLSGERLYVPDLNDLYGRQRDPITEPQKNYLRRLGVGYSGLKYKGQAMVVLDLLVRRSNTAMATPGQLWALHRRGFKDLTDMSFEEASRILDRIGYTRNAS